VPGIADIVEGLLKHEGRSLLQTATASQSRQLL
jgi:hypothetical protein